MPNPRLARYGQAAVDRGFNTYEETQAYNKKSRRGQILKGIVAPTALAFGGPMVYSALAGAGAGAAGASVPGVVAGGSAPLGVGSVAATGGGMTFGNLLKLGELGTGLVTNVIGQRQQNRALDRDAGLRSQEFAQQLEMARADQEQARRQWEAEQAQRAQEYALAIADRDRRVRLEDEDRTRKYRMEDERQARLAPRRAIQQQALMRFGDLLRMGGR